MQNGLKIIVVSMPVKLIIPSDPVVVDRRLTPTWTESRQTISLGGEQPKSLEIMARVGREAAKHVPQVFTGTEAPRVYTLTHNE